MNREENLIRFKNLLNDLVNFGDIDGDVFKNQTVLIYILKKSKYKQFTIEYQNGMFEIIIEGEDKIKVQDYVDFFRKLKDENQIKIINWVEEYIITNS